MKNIFKVDISVYILYLLIILSGYINYLYIYLIIIIMHELGHIIMIKILGYKINKINVSIFGFNIITNININIKSNHLFLISIAGILNQLLLFKLISFNGYNQIIFNDLNKALLIFNLTPIYPLDGYKIYMSIFERFIPYKKYLYISYIVSFICIFFINNIYIIISLLVVNINFYKIHKYYYNKFLLERYLYKFKYKGLISVNDINKIYKTKFNYINGINEEVVLNNEFS